MGRVAGITVDPRKPPTSGWWWSKAVEAFHVDHIAQPARH